MVFAGCAAARWGNRRSLGVAVGTMGAGLLLCAFAPSYLLVLPALLLVFDRLICATTIGMRHLNHKNRSNRNNNDSKDLKEGVLI